MRFLYVCGSTIDGKLEIPFRFTTPQKELFVQSAPISLRHFSLNFSTPTAGF
jgi:hypothetical protein